MRRVTFTDFAGWLSRSPAEHYRRMSLAAALAGATLVFIDTIWLFARIVADDIVRAPHFPGLVVTPVTAIGALAIWGVGLVSLGLPRTRALLGWLAPLGTALAVALDMQTQGDIGVLVVAATAMHWWNARLSADGELSRLRGAPFRVFQVQISVIFVWTVVAKLNPRFMSGAVLSVAFTGPLEPPSFILQRPVLAGLAVATVVTESFIAGGLWLARFRTPALVTAAAFHLFIIVFFGPSLPLAAFALAMASGYLLFAAEPWGEGSVAPPPAQL